ncbi:MAG: hypothetical protein Q8M76_09765, partial [Spirochaetaceae bacterium]|nr:hypothetical protein [Spirochaetaceae bacterium]
AKRRALEEGTTLTELIIQGLKVRLEKTLVSGPLPVSGASGGLMPGIDWRSLELPAGADEAFR